MKNIHILNNSKFKGVSISYNMTLPIIKEDTTSLAVLVSLLSKGSKKYQNQYEIDKYLSNLYGAKFNSSVEKIGDLYNIEFRIEFINENLLKINERILEGSINFLYEIIYNPLLQDLKFKNEAVEIEKLNILDKIREAKDEKLKYGIIKMEEMICENEPFGIFVYGKEEDVAKITNIELYNTYKKIIDKSLINVIVSGNLEGYNNIQTLIQSTFSNCLNENISVEDIKPKNLNSINNTQVIKEIKETSDTNQSVISIGFKVKDLNLEDMYPLLVKNAILGDTPSSKLFQNVREKASLAYTVRSRYYRYKGISIIYAGIEYKNFDLAKKLILEQVENIKLGEITKEELDAAKEGMISDILEWDDYKSVIGKMLFSNILYSEVENITLEYMIDKINNVTIEDIVKVANKEELVAIYFIGGETYE